MWDRAILKQNAKKAISGNKYWTAFAVCLIFALVGSIFSIFGMISGGKVDLTDPQAAAKSVAAATSGTSILQLIVWIFVELPLAVGLARFFVQNRFGKTEFNTLFSSFSGNYMNTIAGMFTTALFIFLWSLLLIVPGILKGLEYTMVRYIMSDNPTISGTRAREISKLMTNGEKGAIFVLYLSFIGWYLLASLVSGLVSAVLWPISGFVGVVVTALVAVYQEATFAELYIFMRDRAIRSGSINPAELNLSL